MSIGVYLKTAQERQAYEDMQNIYGPVGVTGPVGKTGPDFTTVLDEASKIVDGDREQTYGHPAKNFENTALIWSGILGIPVSVNQVALCMVGLKLARQAHQNKRDNLVDGAGYLRCIEKAQSAGYDVMAPHGRANV